MNGCLPSLRRAYAGDRQFLKEYPFGKHTGSSADFWEGWFETAFRSFDSERIAHQSRSGQRKLRIIAAYGSPRGKSKSTFTRRRLARSALILIGQSLYQKRGTKTVPPCWFSVNAGLPGSGSSARKASLPPGFSTPRLRRFGKVTKPQIPHQSLGTSARVA